MNLFIARKVYLIAILSVLLLLTLSVLSAVWQYHRKQPEYLGAFFVDERKATQQISISLEKIKSATVQQGEMVRHLMETNASVNSSVEQTKTSKKPLRIGINRTSINSIGQLDYSSTENSKLIPYSTFLSFSHHELNKMIGIKSSYFLHRINEQEFDVSSVSNALPPEHVLQWLSLNGKTLNNHQLEVFPVPVLITASNPPETNTSEIDQLPNNFLAFNFIIENSMFIWLVELDGTLFRPAELTSTNYKMVVWENESRAVVSSINTAKDISSHNVLATELVPQLLHKQAFFTNLIKTNEHETTSIGEYVVTKVTIADGFYTGLIFHSTKNWFFNTLSESLKSAMVVLVAGCFTLFLFIRLIVIQLALPLSRLLSHIEAQKALVDDAEFIAPRGWHIWFEKIQNIFKENDNLTDALEKKNKQLDSEIRARTRELLQQTVSKDRHLALIESLMNTIPDLLYYKNISGGYLGCNKAYESFIGYQEEDLVTKTVGDIYPPQKASEIDEIEQSVIVNKRSFVKEAWSKTPKGEEFLYLWLYSPIVNSSGEVLGILGLARDITVQRNSMDNLSAAVEQAERANRIKGEFIANISHEIRTPMNSIIGMLQLLDEVCLEANQQNYIKTASSSANNLLTVINNILDFSKASVDKLEIEHETFSVHKIINEAFANTLPKALKKSLLLDMNLPLDFPEFLVGDPVKLGQIFTNLLGNAVKFTHNGSVKLTAQVVEQTEHNKLRVEFRIIDTGIGIAKDQQKKVFEAFSQADSSVTRKYGGTGLGLTIVYQLVIALGGTIEMNSAINVGTEFIIQLELDKDLNAVPTEYNENIFWCFFDEDEQVEDILEHKIAATDCEYTRVTSSKWSQLCEQIQQNTEFEFVLCCRPRYVSTLPKQVIDLLMKKRLKLQPVAFDISDSHTALEEIPHFPLLSSPFDVKLLLGNTSSPLIVRNASQKKNYGLLNGVKILVVEDNVVNQQVIKLMLESELAQIAIVDNGQLALDYIQENQLDIVITDIQMPVMDGLTMAKNIRKQFTSEELPMVVVSAHTHSADVEQSKQVGIDHHLMKPVNKQELLKVVVNSLNLSLLTPLKEVIDIEFLSSQFSNNESAAIKIACNFYQSQNEPLKQLILQMQKNNYKAAKAKLHNLKGMLGNIGAVKAHQLTVELEKIIAQDAPSIELKVELWVTEVTKLLSELALVNSLQEK